MSATPVFIVGSPRSGTSILITALLSAGYNGFLEGNFIPLLRLLERDVDRFYSSFYTSNERVLISKIDQNNLKHRLSELILQTALAQQPPAPWVDKTGGPDMIEIIPFLRRMLPESRYVFAKRRAIENIVSRLVKFPSLTFEYHCIDWARTMAAWRALRAGSNQTDFVEIDQHQISTNPTLVATRLGALLDLAEGQKASMINTFTRQRPQETTAGSGDRVVSLDMTGWTKNQIDVFTRICSEEMALEGYSLDGSYRSSGE